GHGKSVRSTDDLGFIADKNPSDKLIHDINRLRIATAKKYPEKKIGTSLKAARLIESADQIPYADERIEHLRPVEIGEIADAVASLKENL
ncbi:MAG: hypothetical protein IIT52_00120, partial [Candidatus Methanomethylophilus sp.]|nr:hypothetical protein [Methanomethylophilus sp.]